MRFNRILAVVATATLSVGQPAVAARLDVAASLQRQVDLLPEAARPVLVVDQAGPRIAVDRVAAAQVFPGLLADLAGSAGSKPIDFELPLRLAGERGRAEWVTARVVIGAVGTPLVIDEPRDLVLVLAAGGSGLPGGRGGDVTVRMSGEGSTVILLGGRGGEGVSGGELREALPGGAGGDVYYDSAESVRVDAIGFGGRGGRGAADDISGRGKTQGPVYGTSGGSDGGNGGAGGNVLLIQNCNDGSLSAHGGGGGNGGDGIDGGQGGDGGEGGNANARCKPSASYTCRAEAIAGNGGHAGNGGDGSDETPGGRGGVGGPGGYALAKSCCSEPATARGGHGGDGGDGGDGCNGGEGGRAGNGNYGDALATPGTDDSSATGIGGGGGAGGNGGAALSLGCVAGNGGRGGNGGDGRASNRCADGVQCPSAGLGGAGGLGGGGTAHDGAGGGNGVIGASGQP